MNILISIIISSLVVIAIVVLILSLIEHKNKTHSLNEELIKTLTLLEQEKNREKQILFGIINKPTEKDYHLLKNNIEAVDVFTKIIHYEIFKKTDITRGAKSDDNSSLYKNIGGLNQLHELNLFLYKLKNGVEIIEEIE